MRNPLSDVEAVAAMPGLEQMAARIDADFPKVRKSPRDTVSLLILSAAARSMGSQEAAASAFRYSVLWDLARESAARVGRMLPERPPSADQVDRWLCDTQGQVALVAERALNVQALALANTMGLLCTTAPFSVDAPSRAQHITCDGTVTKPLSEVTEANAVMRSRAADPATGARIGPDLLGKRPQDDPDAHDNRGLPFVVASTHTGLKQQRVIFGFETYTDSDEIAAAFRLFDRVIPAANGGIHFVHYDRLMDNVNVAEMARRYGVVPIVESKQSDPRARHAVAVPEGDGRYRRRRHGTQAAKTLLRGYHNGSFHHDCVDGQKIYLRLWSLDGQLCVTPFGDRTLDYGAVPLQRVNVQRRHRHERWEMLVTYRLPCEVGPGCTVTIDLAQSRTVGEQDCRALQHVVAGEARLIHERSPEFWQINGRRSDSESVMSTIKSTMTHHGRASRLKVTSYVWDLVGTALLCNARAWDVHVAQFTKAGQAEYELQQRAAAKRALATNRPAAGKRTASRKQAA